MEERDTPQRDGNYEHHDDRDYEHHPIAEYSHGDPEHTYVVQIPKDQIYRVPPPENALYVEQQQSTAKERKKPLCASCCFYFLITVFVIFLVFGLAALLITIFLKPKAPEIHVDRFVANNSSHNMEYDVRLNIENDNAHTSIEYGQGGVASLSFKNKDVAKGPLPELDLSKNSTASIRVALGGSSNNMPKEIGKSMKSKKPKVRVSLLLKLHMPSRTKLGTMKFGSMTYDVSCKFVVDTLAKGSQILSEQCVTQLV